jgi:aminoglycoside phosphotransferase (APT) family kinase protein
VIDLDRVSAWLGRPLTVEGQATTGSSSTTLFIRAGDASAVLQHPPTGPSLPTAHDLARQHRFLTAVMGSAVPVPRVIAFCDDANVAGAPFLITERKPGVCLLGASTVDIDAAALSVRSIDVLAALHAIDWARRGLTAPPSSYLVRQIDRWREQLARTPTASRLGDLEPIARWLREHRPEDEDRTIVHGDYGFHNLLATRNEITAVLDWELATIGDPLVDLMGFLKSWGADALSPNPANDAVALAAGAFSRDEMIARYERQAGRRFADRRHYYESFALWRSIGVFEGVHARSGGSRFVDEVPQLATRLREMIGLG